MSCNVVVDHDTDVLVNTPMRIGSVNFPIGFFGRCSWEVDFPFCGDPACLKPVRGDRMLRHLAEVWVPMSSCVDFDVIL